MKAVTTCKEIQELILPVMDYFDSICRKHRLRYTLAYGTLLGAVRHKGFIPWDDDVDVLMPRPDYERLIEILKEEENDSVGFLDPNDIDEFFTMTVLKLYNKNTILKEFPEKYHLVYGAFIDVFAVDGIPKDLKEAEQMHKDFRFYKRKVVHPYTSSIYRKKGLRKKVPFLLKPIARFGMGKIRDIFSRYPFDEATHVANIAGWAIKRELLEKRNFDELIELDFEGRKYLSIPNYDEYLRNCYGDYMKLPPVEFRSSGHQLDIVVKE